MENTTARVDLQKLQILSDRIAQTLDALNQVRFSAQTYSADPFMGYRPDFRGFNYGMNAFPAPFHGMNYGFGHVAQPTYIPYGSTWNVTAPFGPSFSQPNGGSFFQTTAPGYAHSGANFAPAHAPIW